MDLHHLPLFPLDMVLFPGAPLALHIFEPRYRTMIGDCLAQQTEFGVVLRRVPAGLAAATVSAGGFDQICAVGTTARIVESVRLQDGRYYLQSNGVRRFRITAIVSDTPYLVARAEPYGTAHAPPGRTAQLRLRRALAQYWQALQAATGQPAATADLDDGPTLADDLAHALQVDVAQKQRWLEHPPAGRIDQMIARLRAEQALLPPTHPAGTHPHPWAWN
jgi:Lon protease-like protein